MSDQLWGECSWCNRRKRLTKGDPPVLYAHAVPGSTEECWGSGTLPIEDSVRNAAGDTPEELAARKAVGFYPPVDVDTWEDDGGFWNRYYWCVVGTGLLALLAFGAFAGGVVWGRR